MNGKRYGGVLPPLSTPFVNGELALDRLKDNLRKYNSTKLSGYLVLGSNGENVYLSEAERLRVLEACREVIPEDRLYMAGTGLESTIETIRFTNQAAETGADCALVITPCYFKARMTPQALREHFLRVAEGAKIPVLLYNVPQFTGVNMNPGLVARLAEHANIVGIKDSSGNVEQLSEIIRLSGPDFAVFVGAAPVFFPSLCMGATGGILAAANVIPDLLVRIQELHADKRYDEARDLQHRLNPLCQWVTSGQGIGGLKLAMDEAGYFGGEVRSPLLMPPNELRSEVREMLNGLT